MTRFLLFLLFLPIASLFAQVPTQTVRGKVVDQDTQLPLIGATIIILDTDPLIGATTDFDGDFRLEKVPVGRYDIGISYLGYEDAKINQLLVGSGKEIVLTIELQESIAELNTVTVVASEQNKGKPLNELATVSARSFSVEETQRYAATFNDPARMAQAYAGVSSASDVSNEIIIRGNSARGLLWRVEGVEIPNPNHFASGRGGAGGGVSILSNTVMANSDFFTGAFPAEYGNALSGVFDIKLRKGNNEKGEYAFQLGALGIQAAVEGPFTKKSKASYLANYRYSSLALMNSLGFEIGDAVVVPKYQDLSFNIAIPTKNAGRFTLFGIGGSSDGGLSSVKDSTQWKFSDDGFEYNQLRTMGVLGLTYNFLMKNNKTYFKAFISYSIEDDTAIRDSLDQNYERQFYFRDEFRNFGLRAGLMANHKFNPKHLIRAGLNYDWLLFQTDLAFLAPGGNQRLEDFSRLESDLIRSYIQWQWRPVKGFQMNTGLHHTSFVLNNNHILEPRFGMRWQWKPRIALSYGLGLHSRLEPISLYFDNLERPLGNPVFTFDDGNSFLFSPRSTLRITQSVHNVLGIDFALAQDYVLKAEFYHQALFNVPVANDSMQFLSTLNFNSFDREFQGTNLINKGRGYNYGVEFTLEKFFSKNYYFLFTTSLFQSTFSALDDTIYNTRFNGNYILNLLGGKEWKVGKNKEHIFGLNLRLVWAGGNRSTPIDLEQSIAQGRQVLEVDQLFEDRLPNYFRVDTGLSYRWNQPKYAFITTIDVQNVFNRLNVEEEIFDTRAQVIRQITQLAIVPIINFRIEF